VFVTALFVLPVWLLVALPLYFLVPRTSFLWHPAVAAPAGCIGGAAVLTLYAALFWPDWQPYRVLLPIAVLVGGVTCLYAAATADRFHALPR
jgi:hypothetical protein